MATYTTNLNLKKPAGSENVSIGDINNNMDTIDSAVGTLSDQIASHLVYGGQKSVTLAANAQTEVQIDLPNHLQSGDYYTAVANVEFYGTANAFSPVLIRSKAGQSFTCRIYNSGDAVNVKINWLVMRYVFT